MRQKFTLLKNGSSNSLVIKEYAELEKDSQSLLCEETYPLTEIKKALKLGRDNLIRLLCTNNLYPPAIYIDQIAQSVERMVEPKGQDTSDLFFDDIDLMGIPLDGNPLDDIHDAENDAEDDLLDDDNMEDTLDDALKVKNLKIADDETAEADDV